METLTKTSANGLHAELANLDRHGQDRLEEFTFCVAEDLKWLNEYTDIVLEQLSVRDFQPETNPLEARSPLKELQIDSDHLNSRVRSSPIQKSKDDHVPIESVAGQNPVSLRGHADTGGPEERGVNSSLEPETIERLAQDAQRRESDERRTVSNATIVTRSDESHEVVQLPLISPEKPEEATPADVEDGHPPSCPGSPPAKVVAIHSKVAQSTTERPNSQVKHILAQDERSTFANGSGPEKEGNRDYMQPINLDSPPKRETSRADSAYFSAAESPNMSKSTSSPRQSIAFASLPARQPLAKKSLGPRSSQSRASVFEGTKSASKSLETVRHTTVVKHEQQSSPPAGARIEASVIGSIVKKERTSVTNMSHSMDSSSGPVSIVLGLAAERNIISNSIERAKDMRMDEVVKSRVVGVQGSSEPIQSKLPTEDEDWLPRFNTGVISQQNIGHEVVLSDPLSIEVPGAKDAHYVPNHSAPVSEPSPFDAPLPKNSGEKVATGPIRAAMQAASAKATSYLRQARTAFGSPAINHTKVFQSTTPMYSPSKIRPKAEPQTPSLYPDLNTAQNVNKPSMIPSKTPRKSPLKAMIVEQTTPRRSPRRSPKKGTEASHSMAIMAARSATRIVSLHQDQANEKNEEKEQASSPKKSMRLLPKFATQTKSKPLSIRVATASQREIDNVKERKVQVTSGLNQHGGPPPPLSRSTSETSQLDYLNKSQSGTSKRPAPSRQIKALAAANQAKEKADKEQERRDLQRREIERKRQEAKRQTDDEDKRKAEQLDEMSKKRKANADSRTASAKKPHLKPMQSKGQLRERTSVDPVAELPGQKTTQQAPKRPLAEIEETSVPAASNAIVPKRRCTDEQSEMLPNQREAGTSVVSKPVRVSLQKKSLFGHPGEPGYKKPSTQPFSKNGTTVELVKFSNDHIRSAGALTSTTTVQTNAESARSVNLPPSELIELPEINSDYSDSDDDEPPQKDGFERPAWAESPELRKLLRRQQKIDPDDVFGPVPPLQMEEIFKGKERALARFRPRSSSANWSGNDKLTGEEVAEYARVMGYRN